MMTVWMIADTGNNNTLYEIAFETKAACLEYIERNGNDGWKAVDIRVYSFGDF